MRSLLPATIFALLLSFGVAPTFAALPSEAAPATRKAATQNPRRAPARAERTSTARATRSCKTAQEILRELRRLEDASARRWLRVERSFHELSPRLAGAYLGDLRSLAGKRHVLLASLCRAGVPPKKKSRALSSAQARLNEEQHRIARQMAVVRMLR